MLNCNDCQPWPALSTLLCQAIPHRSCVLHSNAYLMRYLSLSQNKHVLNRSAPASGSPDPPDANLIALMARFARYLSLNVKRKVFVVRRYCRQMLRLQAVRRMKFVEEIRRTLMDPTLWRRSSNGSLETGVELDFHRHNCSI